MSRYFSLFEFLYSDTAHRKNIDNIPTFEYVHHLEELAEFLDGLREEWGGGISVNSGYRCPQLNSAVGGSDTSAHCVGYAADLYPKNGKFEEFKAFVVNYVKDKEYDQCILEKSGKSQWVHLGIRNRKGEQRHQCFKIIK